MVSAMINISEQANRILNIVKAKHGLKDKSQAIDYVVLSYGDDLLEPELRPEFVQKMRKRSLEKSVKIKDFKKHFRL